MKIEYRPDIQGLRAIAVLLVFFSHAHWPLFHGGFVGVDVFYVISGYVITQILLREYREQGAILLHRFYARRLQRLLPALAFMLLVTTLVSFIVLTPSEQLFQYGTAVSAALWLSNIFLLFSDVSYFGQDAGDNLYLHTWSLGVEEQFYLVWPVLILAGLGHFSDKDKKAPRLVLVLGLTLAVSLALCLFLSVTSAKQAFYLMPARAWQFASGALVAYWHSTRAHEQRFNPSTAVMNLIGGSGLGLIVLSAMWFDRATPYPNWQVLVPTIGITLTLLAYRRDQGSHVGRTLSIQPLRWLGDISYSFYLWHWPILLFAERLNPFYSGGNALLALGATLAMAAFSYYLIENPIRRNQRMLMLPKRVVGGALTAMLLIGISMSVLKSYSSRLELDPQQRHFAAIRYQVPVIYQYGCDDWYHSAQVRPCVVGDGSSKKKAVLIGDSVLMQWFPAIADHFVSRNWQVVVLTKSSCPMVNRPFFYERIKSVYHVCDVWREQAIRTITGFKPQVVVMGSASSYPFSKAEWQDGTRELFDRLLPHVGQIKLIAGTPRLGFDGPLCLARRDWLSKTLPGAHESTCSGELHPSETWNWLSEVASEYSQVHFIDLSQAVCPASICSAKIDDTIVFRDGQHLTVDFVMTLKENLGTQLPGNKEQGSATHKLNSSGRPGSPLRR
jgi:peptidoglycan/LPS O-acetylase OafA/YrhL